jgi:hypothetical protein
LALLVVTSAAPGVGVRNVSASPLDKLDPRLRAHVSTTADIELGGLAARAQAQTASNYFPVGDDGCAGNRADNVKVNQNCVNVADATLQGRSQAQNETSIAVDPGNPSHLVASYNDYRRGDGNCGGSFSLDGGRSWADTTMPTGFTTGASGASFGAARQYWQAGGDTSVAWDTRGNAYMSCQVFQRGQPTTNNPDLSSAFTLFRSTRNNGGSWNFPGHFSTFNNDVAASGAILEDKALLTVDNHAGSPFRDRIYVTWTEFTPTTAYIYEVASNDYGQTFGPRQLVSATSTLCRFPISGAAGGCDNNQFSDPFTGPDGALYVTWANYNTVDFSVANPGPAKFQTLIAKSTDGGNSFGAPQLAGTYYELPDCPTYTGQDPGRSCVPEKASTSNSIFRATNYPSGAVNPRNPKEVAVSFGSYINQNSNEKNGCTPTGSVAVSTGGLYTGVRTPGACNNDIVLSVSKDGGATYTGTTADPRSLTTVTPTSRQSTSDQWFQWLAYAGDGRLAVSYYDRQYGSDETTGFSDFSLSGSRDLVHFGVTRVTSSSNPPPTQFGGVFLGDYTGLDASSDRAFPTWSDTRGRELFLCPNTAAPGAPPQLCGLMDPNGPANDEDIFTAGVEVPDRG